MNRPLIRIGLLLIATAAAALSLAPLIEPRAWAPAAIVGVGAAAAPLALLRLVTTWEVRPTLIAIATSTVATLVYELTSGSVGAFLPTSGTRGSVLTLATQGAETLRTHDAPVTGGPGVALIVTAGLSVLFIAAEALVVGAQAPALAGAPLLLMWAPAVVLTPDVHTGLILAAAGSFTALLALSTIPRGRLASVAPAVAAITALTVLSTMILTPWALSYPSWMGSLAQGSSTRLDLGLDVRRDLERGENTEVIRYYGLSPGELGPLHSHTLSDFDGQQWGPGEEESRWLETSQLWPEGGGAMIDRGGVAREVTVTVGSLDSDRLFLPEGPRESADPVLYDPERDELVTSAANTPGTSGSMSYSLQRLPIHGDPQRWHEQSLTSVEPRNAQAYLDLPATSKREGIDALTAKIISGATTPYEQAVAIQDFLRTTDRFEYTTSVPSGTSDDAVWDFLEHGQGYCVQFATAMVTMARSAGIPARMAVGFLPGTADPAADAPGGVVRTHDAHTWPQLHLGGAGWARFEPTPATRTGAVPELARGLPDPGEPEPTADPSEPAAETSPPPRDVADSPEPPASAPATSESATDALGDTALGWAILALSLAVGGAGLAAHRRRQHSRALWGVEEYWQAALTPLRTLGLTLTPRDTPTTTLLRARALDVTPRYSSRPPRDTADALAGAGSPAGSPGRHASDGEQWAAELEPFARLTEELNITRYASRAAAGTPEQYARWVAQTREGASGWVPRERPAGAPRGRRALTSRR